jgi:hypothetical protein
MFIAFLSKWNPFNIYGKETHCEDLIHNPLQSDETLMQDSSGCYHRIRAPLLIARKWNRLKFWCQRRLNKKGHVETIHAIISLFWQKVLNQPLDDVSQLNDLKFQLTQLSSLKNDYCFNYLKKGDPRDIEMLLADIEKQAYRIFEFNYQQKSIAEEKKRRQTFLLFQEQIEQQLVELHRDYLEGLTGARLLIITPFTALEKFLSNRLYQIQQKIDRIEKLYLHIEFIHVEHQGKFTIPYIREYLTTLKEKLCCEIKKIHLELNFIIENLTLNYCIFPLEKKIVQLMAALDTEINLSFYQKQEEIFLELDHLRSSIQKILIIF